MTNPLSTAAAAQPSESHTRAHRSWPWIVVAIVIAFGKTEGFRLLEHHVWGWAIVLGVMSGWSLLRARPVLAALFAAPVISLLLTPHPVGVGVAVGFATFAVLMSVFVAIGTALRSIDSRRDLRRGVASAQRA